MERLTASAAPCCQLNDPSNSGSLTICGVVEHKGEVSCSCAGIATEASWLLRRVCGLKMSMSQFDRFAERERTHTEVKHRREAFAKPDTDG